MWLSKLELSVALETAVAISRGNKFRGHDQLFFVGKWIECYLVIVRCRSASRLTRSHWALGTSLVRALSYDCGNVEVVNRTFYRTLRVSSSRLNHMTDLSINITIYRSHVTMHTATTIQMIGCCNVFAVPWSSCIDSSVVFLTVDQNTLAPAFLWALFCNHGSIPRRYRKYSLFASYPQARLLCNETGRMRLAPKKERGLERIRGN